MAEQFSRSGVQGLGVLRCLSRATIGHYKGFGALNPKPLKVAQNNLLSGVITTILQGVDLQVGVRV